MLKHSPNGQLSIEKFDDIAFDDDNHGQCLLQAKHHVEAKSLSDKSVDLWKTIRVWLGGFQSASLTAGNIKRLIITTACAENDSAASLLRPGRSKKDLDDALVKLRKAAADSKNSETQIPRQAFLKLNDDEAKLFLESIEIFDKHPNLTDMMTEIEGELVLLSPSHKSLIAEYLEGWWMSVIAKHLLDENSGFIPVQHIITKAHEIGSWFKDDGLPVDTAEELGAQDYSPQDEDAVFVQQMRIVGITDSAVQRGVRDFYRSSAQRSKWARESLLLDGETEEYDRGLQDRWARRFDADCAECGSESDEVKAKVGRAICNWATQEQVGFRNVVETWITAGSFHSLADRLEIGWHPDFESKLKAKHG